MVMLNNQMVMDVKRTCADATGKPLFGGKNPFGEHSLEPIQWIHSLPGSPWEMISPQALVLNGDCKNFAVP